jgi:tetratricopeptide (TPR) repeat protein
VQSRPILAGATLLLALSCRPASQPARSGLSVATQPPPSSLLRLPSRGGSALVYRVPSLVASEWRSEGRLPEPAGRLARALAILEQSELHQAARFTGLDEVEAEAAAELLMTPGILDTGRPLGFSHPIVRASLYGELSGAERSQGHLRAARLLAEEPGAGERVAKHLLASEPSGDHWVFERLLEAGYAAARNGAPESAARFLRRALTEPPPPVAQQPLLLELGRAEESAGLEGWAEHLRRAVEAAPNAVKAAEATRVLASALNRSQRFSEAVQVLDRAASALGA